MGLHSGKFARVNGVDTMRMWAINETMRIPKAVASNTLLGTARRKGVMEWSGMYSAYGAVPVVLPGDTLSFIGYGSPDNDVSGATGLRYEGDAVVQSVKINWNWKTGDILSHEVNFQGHLELVKATGADPGDAVTPNLPEVAPCKVQYALGALTSYADLPNVESASLTIQAAVQSYVNTSTYINSKLWTGRKFAGAIDWGFSAPQQDVNRLAADIFGNGDTISLRLFTDASLYWELKYGMVRDFSGVRANRETGEIMARTINVDMNGYYGSNVGSIKKPGGTTWWPF